MARTRNSQEDHFNVGIRMLECLVRWPTLRGVTQLAKELDLAPSSTHDLLKVLCTLGFVIHEKSTRKYAPSPRFFEFINFFTTHFGITPKVQDLISRRSNELGLSIFLGTVWQKESYVVCTSGQLGGVNAIGSHGPLVFTSIGKAILAEESPEAWERHAGMVESAVLPKGAERPTKAAFLRELDRVAESKVAWNIFSTVSNIFSVASAICLQGNQSKYAVAIVFSKEMYYLLDRSNTEATVRKLRDEIHEVLKT
jgi:DNA-binding IclR family transcriptional regulator